MKKIDGLYHGHYEIKTSDVEVKKEGRAYIVPGQGAAYPGMFKEFLDHNEDFTSVFRFADDNSGLYDLLPVSTYVRLPGTLPQAKMHIYRNCALYTAEVAIGRNLIRKGLSPDAITGHSFGECAGLVLAGIFSIEEMFHVVVHRNLLCPPANELGFMVTLNGNREKLKEFLGSEGVYLANLNSPKQLVVSIASDKKEWALDWLRSNRVPHLVLQGLPQPYHSPLMEPYRKKLHERLSQLKLSPQKPATPFFSGILHHWITPENISSVDFVDLLARQLTEPVNFIEQVEALKKNGCTRWYEVGPGKMLEPPLKTILGDAIVVYRNVEALLPNLVDLKRLSKPQNDELKKSKWFSKIKDVLQTVTGYKTEDIDIAHSFQNDLGIDSIKKAEILVKIIKDENLNSNSDFSVTRFSTIYEAVEYLENYSDEVDPLKSSHEKLIEAVVPHWEFAPRPVLPFLVEKKSTFLKTTWRDDFLSGMMELTSGSSTIYVIDTVKTSVFGQNILNSLLSSWQKLLPKLELMELHVCLLDKTSNGDFWPVSALLRSLVKETREFSFTYIHSPDGDLDEEDIRQEISFSQIRDVRFKDGKRLVKNFRTLTPTISAVRKSMTFVAVGGSRGISHEILRRFPVIAGDRLILMGRTDGADPSIREHLKLLKDQWKNFEYLKVNAENAEETVKVLSGKVTEIDILLNASGMEVSKNFSERKVQDVVAEENSKLLPLAAVNLIRKKLKVKKTFIFSSVVSHFGNKGQAVYAFTNARIEHSLSEGMTALAWGPWEDVGMTTNLGILQKIKEWGISLISPAEGAELAHRLFLTDDALPNVILPMDKKDVLLLSAEQHTNPVLGKLSDNFEAVFQKKVSIEKEFYLSDHVMLGRKVLPAAYFISQILAYGRTLFSKMVSVEDFTVLNMLFMEDSDSYEYKFQCFPREPYDVNIYSIIRNAQGKINPDAQFSPFKVTRAVDEKKIDLLTFYEVEESFGALFQFVKHAYLDQNKNLRVEIHPAEIPVLSGNRVFDFWLFLIDLTFQALSLQVKAVTGGVIMPVSFGRLIFADEQIEVTGPIQVFTQVHQQTDRDGRGDILITNEDNVCFCKIENVYFRKHFLLNRSEVRMIDS